MKKTLLLICILILSAFTAQAGILDFFDLPTAIAISDTSSLTTHDTLVSIAGEGMLYSITFNNDDGHDTCVVLTIDGVTDSVTCAADEERTAFVIRNFTPGIIGADDNLIDVVNDSTFILGNELNLPFHTEMKIEYSTEASGGAQINAIYGVVK